MCLCILLRGVTWPRVSSLTRIISIHYLFICLQLSISLDAHKMLNQTKESVLCTALQLHRSNASIGRNKQLQVSIILLLEAYLNIHYHLI